MDRRSIGSLLSGSVSSPRKRMSIAQSLKRQSSAMSVSGRSNQSVQVIFRSPSHMVESFGSTLPVLVTEALTSVDIEDPVSASISNNGWAWLVCGRKLLVWQCKTTMHDPKQRHTFKNQCRELPLPPSDLAHKANCIAVWVPPSHQVPSCMAVSPEGIVRYWTNIAHEESSVETSAELTGQEVECLTYVPGHGCILATTTCTVALLQTKFQNGRNSVSCRVLRTSQGWLGGIGRRMSSIIFGSISQSPAMETKRVKVTCNTFGDRGSRVLILAGSSLQCWSFLPGEQEKMEFEEDIGHSVTQSFIKNSRNIWMTNITTQSVETWLIDMQTNDEGIVLFMAGNSLELSRLTYFALGLLPFNGNSFTNSFKWFIPISKPLDAVESTLFSYRFILAGWEAIIYNPDTVLVVNISNENEQDKIDFVRKDCKDKILGGDLCSGTPVLFTIKFGLVTIISTDFSTQDLNTSYNDVNNSVDYRTNTSFTDNLTSLIPNEKIREMYYSADGVEQLKAAFLFSLRQNRAECEQILSELFPPQEEPIMDIDSNLDTLVLNVGKKFIDDYPPNDPRWANYIDTSMNITSVMSMQITHQLEGKQKALDLFVTFLKEYNLWNRFCAVTYRGIVMATSHVLGEYAEKIVAALAIFNLQNRYPDIMDEIIEQTLTPELYVSNELTAKDIFYREVSSIHLLLPTLVNSAVEVTQSDRPIQQISQYILQINSIILGVLSDVINYRQNNANRFVPWKCSNAVTEYLPWTAAFGKQDLRTCLHTLQNLTLKHGVTGTNDSTVKNELYDQIVGLIDLILDGRKCHLESIRGTEKFEILLKQYETERSNLIQPLIKNEQYENAAKLAEKYLDFASLIQICLVTKNESRLDGYIKKYSSQDFVGFLFSSYIKDGKQGQLVERCRQKGASELIEKIAEHPEFSWVQASLSEEYRLAANTLHSLAYRELDLIKRKKNMLSLSKLALMCSDETDQEINEVCSKINSELELIAHQEDLPDLVLEAYGYDTKKLRVLTPTDLITLCTCEENTVASELDFKKSLDLLDYIHDEDEKSSLRQRIWARAALRDQWDNVSNNPEQQIQETFFFKLISSIHLMEDSIEDFLPPVDLLLREPELGSLAASNNFEFLIKLIYERASQNFQIN